MLHNPSQSTVSKGTKPSKSLGGRIPGKGAQDLRKPLRRRNGTQGCGSSQAALLGFDEGKSRARRKGLRENCYGELIAKPLLRINTSIAHPPPCPWPEAPIPTSHPGKNGKATTYGEEPEGRSRRPGATKLFTLEF